jgi:hypothetical protein
MKSCTRCEGKAERIKQLETQLDEAQKNAAFYKCCALSGEIPTNGSEPWPTSEVIG